MSKPKRAVHRVKIFFGAREGKINKWLKKHDNPTVVSIAHVVNTDHGNTSSTLTTLVYETAIKADPVP